jgi:hypothetical protein
MNINPFSNAVATTLNTVGNACYGLNERGKHRAIQLEAEAEATHPILRPITKVVAAPLSSLLANGTKLDFDHFSFTPELGGATIPHLPLMATLIMFYGFMVPARIDSEIKRADKLPPQALATEGLVNKGIRGVMKLFYRDTTDKAGNKKENRLDSVDIRPVRDVLIRDMISISLFLFALEPAQQLLREKKQRDGAIFSWGKSTTQPVLAIMDRPWNPNETLKSWSYEKTNRLYSLNNLKATEHFANLFGANTFNGQSAEIYRRAVTGVNLYQTDAPFTAVADETVAHLQQLGIKQKALTNAFKLYYQTHQLAPNKVLGADEQLALSLLFEQVPALKSHEKVLALTPNALQSAVTTAKEGVQKRIEAALAVAGFDLQALETLKNQTQPLTGTHHTHQPFAESFLKAYHEGDLAAYKKMMLLVSNVGGLVDSVVDYQAQNATTTTASGNRFDRYGKVWDSLQGLKDLLPQYQLLRHTEGLLAEEIQAGKQDAENGFLAGVKGLFNHSKQALAGIEQLTLLTQQARDKGQAVGVKNLFGKVSDTFNPQEVFKDFARGVKAPVDWMTFALVAGVIGFVPVWINQVYTDLEFKWQHAKDKMPTSELAPSEVDLGAFDYLPLVPKSGILPSVPKGHRFHDLAKTDTVSFSAHF